ncbi:MAG: hypothetical protein AMJ78_00940 [Omnitrophica WOR_2 bacterium SM23_29]|nr:MAG: hypothetical protein AMJ78_00940 [Omnitrophica WOR_2 bacterium SM23_29]
MFYHTKDLSKDKLIELYVLMLRIRLVELKIEELYPQDEMKTPIHLCIGQEAVAAGVCANLNKDDYVFSTHRGHGHYLAKGGSLKAMIAELYGRETGCTKGRGGSMHLIDTSVGFMGCSSIVGGNIPIATGAALSSVLCEHDKVSVVFFGDAATEEGILYESMNFAAFKKLPVIYVCENNFYSVYSHQSARQANDHIHMRPKAFDIPSYQIDGANVAEVYLNSKKAIVDARSGKGPSFLECKVYRWRAHSGPGDPLKEAYRKKDEWKKWMKKDPLKDFENILVKESIITDKEIKNINEKIDKDILEAFEFAKSSPFPDKGELMKYLFR